MSGSELSYYKTGRPGFWSAIARAFGLSYGWKQMTFDEILVRSFYVEETK